MAGSLGIIGRDKYLTTAQKIVQARVWAQGLTVAVLIASLALEGTDASQGKGRWETVKVLDPSDPEHKRLVEKKIHHEKYAGEDQWRDMVEAEEERIKEREKWLDAFERSCHHSISLLDVSGGREEGHQPTSMMDRSSVASIVAAGLPLPKSPSKREMLAALANNGTAATSTSPTTTMFDVDDPQRTEQAERAFWMMRFRSVRRARAQEAAATSASQ